MLLVAAETSDGQEHSILLQNAETVKLVGPPSPSSAGSSSPSGSSNSLRVEGGGAAGSPPAGGERAGANSKGTNSDKGTNGATWHAHAVTELEPGDYLYVKRSASGTGRHLGTAVQETLNEW